MGRNYTDRYLRNQQSNYSQRLPRTSTINSSLTDIFSSITAKMVDANGPPEGFQEVILEWLDTNLTPVVKRSINFRKISNSNPRFIWLVSTIESMHPLRGLMEFCNDHVRVSCEQIKLDVSVEYAHPELFELLQRALTRLYNGT